MNIVGISGFYHDSAACLVRDGEIVAAAQEERFTRKKHDERFPKLALEYCLAEAKLAATDLDIVAFYDKPLLKFGRLLETYTAFWPSGFRMFLRGVPVWLKHKLHTARELDAGLGPGYTGRYVFLEHHESHAASAFYPSPFDDAAIVTLDGVGEWATGSIARGRGNRIEMLEELRFPHSLGLLYSAFTYFTGFKVNSGEYKLMGLSPYGTPVFKDAIMRELLDLKADGSFRLNMQYFGYCDSDVMTSPALEALLGGPPRAPEAPITQREMDLAASIQAVTEEIVLRIARHARELTGCANLVLAGGVALNCVANAKLREAGIFDDLWVQPAAGDAGAALGAALFVWHQLLGNERPSPCGKDRQRGSLLGPQYSDDRVKRDLDSAGAVYTHYADEDELADKIAELIDAGRVVGHCAGRMEFGPRALGSRSILGDARSPEMQRVMNAKIKFRESFRPFAPAILQERAHEYFAMRPGQASPYMSIVVQINDTPSSIPAVTHVDDSARVQTVDAERHPRFYKVLKAFEKRTGCPLMINTSFNVRGEPIVNTPADAYRCFIGTHMDALVIESFLLFREQQPESAAGAPGAHPAAFAPD